ncbi:MAG: hypothetical protein HC809_11865, partial [Gammaproteobacteria bacterium]|nr:hypothetical protein [Gammaproteobacteria bacterium]
MSNHDFTARFTFDRAPIRGRLVRLESTWQQLSARRDYAPAAASLLAELAVSAGLLSQDLKVEGRLTIQLHPGADTAMFRTAMAARGTLAERTVDRDLDRAELARGKTRLESFHHRRPSLGAIEFRGQHMNSNVMGDDGALLKPS